MTRKRFELCVFMLAVLLLVAGSVIAQGGGSDEKGKKKDDDADFLVVPSGTQIKAQYEPPYEYKEGEVVGKVVFPVRVGWATAIPAGSKVTLRFSSYGATLTSVTVDGTTYKVKTLFWPIEYSRPYDEIPFTLGEQLKIKR